MANGGSVGRRKSGAQTGPTVGGSTYVRPQDMEWRSAHDKISVKVLYENKETGEAAKLVKMEPGAHSLLHMHPGLEQAYVLEGSMYDHDGKCGVGEYVRRKAGPHHENWTDTGCVILAIYSRPNVFVEEKDKPAAPRTAAKKPPKAAARKR